MARTRKSDEWLLNVRSTIGGSSAAAIVGKARFKTRHDVYMGIIGARSGQLKPERETDDLRRGSVFEKVAIEVLADQLNCEIRPHDQDQFVFNPAMPWAHALPDGELPDGGLVEMKVPRPQTIARVRARGLFPEWTIQAIHNATICDRPYTMVGMLDVIAGLCEYIRVERDPDEAARLMAAEEEFWSRYIIGDAELPLEVPTGPAPEPEVGDIVVLDSPEAQAAADNYCRLRALVDDTDDLLDEAKLRLARLSGCTVVGDEITGGPPGFVIPGVLRVNHKSSPGRKTFDKDRAIAKYPDLSAAEFFKTSKGSRPWRATILNRTGD